MGCEQSVPINNNDKIKAVGQTERLVSRAERLKQKQTKQPAHPKLDGAGNLMPEEIVRRTSNSIVTKHVMLGTQQAPISMEYAHWTQRGYYPDTPHKENQDSLGITLNFANETNSGCMMGIYDGHGTEGHTCSEYVNTKLPNIIAKHIKKLRVDKYKKQLLDNNDTITKQYFAPDKWPYLSEKEYQQCCRKGFLECNELMHKNDQVDDKYSGTTAITVQFHGDMMTVCNVGDSRAILGHKIATAAAKPKHRSLDTQETEEEEKNEIGETDNDDDNEHHRNGGVNSDPCIAIPLSRDQTPYRKDERERVRKQGAVIMSIDQMQGLEKMHDDWGDMVLGEVVDVHGDPPRIWVKDKEYPGCAFTRSIGDFLAEDIGVTAEPEIVTTQLTSNDKYLVIASDGIFEFVPDQEVIDICVRSTSPYLACQNLVQAAYDQWLIHENRTDDITVIVCFLDCTTRNKESSSINGVTKTTEDLVRIYQETHKQKQELSSARVFGVGTTSSVTSKANETAATTMLDEDRDSDTSAPSRTNGGGGAITRGKYSCGNSVYEIDDNIIKNDITDTVQVS